MSSRWKLIAATALALGFAASAYAMQDASAQLRASGEAGESYDGYLGIVGQGSAGLRARVDAVNIKRRAYYAELAQRRGATIEEVGAATACEIFATRVGAGQYFRLPDGIWRQRAAGAPVPRPGYCG